MQQVIETIYNREIKFIRSLVTKFAATTGWTCPFTFLCITHGLRDASYLILTPPDGDKFPVFPTTQQTFVTHIALLHRGLAYR
jgi:hypothetical protein